MHAQSRPTVCDPLNCSPPGSPVHGIFQARILEWIAISYSRGSSWPGNWTCMSCVSCVSRQILYHCTPQEGLPSHTFQLLTAVMVHSQSAIHSLPSLPSLVTIPLSLGGTEFFYLSPTPPGLYAFIYCSVSKYLRVFRGVFLSVTFF